MELNEMNLTPEQLANVQKYVQSAEDRIRTDYSKKLKDANEELNKYKPIEKTDAELDLENRIAALEAREKEIANREKMMNISSKLKEKQLPEGLSKFLNLNEFDDENIDFSIDELGALFGNHFLNGSNKPGNHATNKGLTKEDFKKMSYLERTKLYQDNSQLYQALSK